MSANNRHLRSTNPFEDDEDEADDIDDDTFLRNSRRHTVHNTPSTMEEQLLSLQEQRGVIEDRTLRSTARSIGLLRESEQVGVATAEELSRQREKLEKTDRQLDEINATLRFSQKHINGIKSVFSSLKNYMSGRNEASMSGSSGVSSSKIKEEDSSSLRDKLGTYDRYENHPTTRLRQTDDSVGSSGSKDFSLKLDENLKEMQLNISQLKGLAKDLSYEIDSQNELIGNITDKAELADITVHKQNREMQKILKK